MQNIPLMCFCVRRVIERANREELSSSVKRVHNPSIISTNGYLFPYENKKNTLSRKRTCIVSSVTSAWPVTPALFCSTLALGWSRVRWTGAWTRTFASGLSNSYSFRLYSWWEWSPRFVVVVVVVVVVVLYYYYDWKWCYF